MSWFDGSSFASIAKSALKEAQRTIDKALDIRDEGISAPTNTPVDINSDDFFHSWGVTANVAGATKAAAAAEEVVTKSPAKSSKMSASIWGSFTGSFFDNAVDKGKSKDSMESLDDSGDLVDFKASKLVVQHSDDGEGSQRLLSDDDFLKNLIVEGEENSEISLDVSTVKRREKSGVYNVNRLSVISTESDRKSSESVEVLSNTECTTSPESDALSYGQSISTISSDVKQITDSVEVLLDSLTSPSSIELLDPDISSSRRQSQHTDEFVSPLESPGASTIPPEKSTPDSIEVILEEQDENSIAEDTVSYTSISESTATTVLDSTPLLHQMHQKQHHPAKPDMSASCESDKSASGVSDVPITRPPSRTALHLPLAQVNLISTQPQSIKENVADLLQTSNIIDIPSDLNGATRSSLDEGSHSDRTLIASSDLADSSTDTSDSNNYNSTYLKNMLADAMVEKNCECDATKESGSDRGDNKSSVGSDTVILPPRETSPLSSERSDMVKIGSDQASGHTSGDELETTTSSDIEIISSPNGDSSSTHSRHSPSKVPGGSRCKAVEPNVDALLGKMTFKRIKGHNRELSEASSMSDESEAERLVRRISEITEILESRESKLIEVSRKNAELQELNGDLRDQLDRIHTKQIESLDLSQVTEEYTQRLSALERKFQQAIREKDSLRKQLDECKKDATQRLSKSEIDAVLLEKEETIKELRDEGEKLSKQQLQHSNIIKKLRTKEKEHESAIKYLKENVEDLTSDVDRLKKSLTAKEEVERTQIEAVHQLTTKNKKLEAEIHNLKGNLEDFVQKYETAKKSLDAAKRELADKSKTSNELLAREQLLHSLEDEKRMTESQNEEIISHLEDLRTKLREADESHAKKEQILRSENSELLRRLEDAERRNEELAQSVMEISKPLVRQLESLQAAYNVKVSNFEQAELSMTVKINDLQTKVKTLADSERIAREDCASHKTRLLTMETQLSELKQEKDLTLMQMDQKDTEHMFAQQKLKSDLDVLQTNLKTEKELVENLRKEVRSLQVSLDEERSLSNENPLSVTLQDRGQSQGKEDVAAALPSRRSVSPTLSLGKMSLSESLSTSLWLNDDVFDTTPGRCTNILEMQYIQTNLKQREGEVQQLQWELNRREHERTIMNKEISSLLTKVEGLEVKVKEHENLAGQFTDLQKQYDTLCQLYGEKVEETEELKLDLVDVKDMYKSQIDELLRQNREGKVHNCL